jgi:hypothetical protein
LDLTKRTSVTRGLARVHLESTRVTIQANRLILDTGVFTSGTRGTGHTDSVGTRSTGFIGHITEVGGNLTIVLDEDDRVVSSSLWKETSNTSPTLNFSLCAWGRTNENGYRGAKIGTNKRKVGL